MKASDRRSRRAAFALRACLVVAFSHSFPVTALAKPRGSAQPTSRSAERPSLRPATSATGTSQIGPVTKGPIVPMGHVPEQNKAMYLGYKGYVDTEIAFGDFFDAEHTISVWWYPQYAYGHTGPIVSDVGPGNYAFGQLDYRKGDGGFMDAGRPMFFIRVGNRTVKFMLAEAKTQQWIHLAVVRKGDTLLLYVNGTKRTPVEVTDKEKNTLKYMPHLSLAGVPNKPTGKIRLGRDDLSKIWQAYGLIDDLAVFKKALTASELKAIRDAKRLTGHESGLLAGLSFEKPISSSKPLPAKLAGSWPNNDRAYHVPVSGDRKASDGGTFNNAFIIGVVSKPVQLPFKKDEVWRVVQGQNDPAVSHNGTAVFCYDFVLHKSGAAGKNYPEGTRYAPVYAGAAGKVVSYRKNGSYVGREPFNVRIEIGPKEALGYLHLAKDQLTPKATGGTPNDKGQYFVPARQAKSIAKGEEVGKLGPNAAHLHFSGTSGEKVTIPIAFDDYWASDDDGATWKKVYRGHPKKGQLIKRQ